MTGPSPALSDGLDFARRVFLELYGRLPSRRELIEAVGQVYGEEDADSLSGAEATDEIPRRPMQ